MKTRVFQIYCKFFSQRHREHRGILIVLLAVLMLTGCDPNPHHENIGFIPIGEWIGPDDYGEPDKYIITNNKITYVDPWDFNNFSSEITASIDFTSNAGVIIIKILNDPVPDTLTPNKYTCIYYRDYTSTKVLLANPIDTEFNYIEADTLTEAKNIFTVDNVNTHVLTWGSYTK